jgi:outer membrane protein
LDAAKAKLALVRSKVAAAKQAVSSAENKLAQAQVELDFLKRQTRSIVALAKTGGVPEIDAIKARSKLSSAEKVYEAALDHVKEAKLEAGAGQRSNPELDAARVQYQLAKDNLAHCTYHAPMSGIISNLQFHKGDFVAPGRPLFAIVNSKSVFIVANFPETVLAKIKPELARLYRSALTDNPTYKSTIFKVAASSATHDEALSAFLPNLQVNAGYGHFDSLTNLSKPFIYLPTMPTRSHSVSQTDLIMVKLTQVIFDYSFWANLKASTSMVEASKLGREKLQQQLTYNLLSDYLRLVDLKQNAKYLEHEQIQVEKEYQIIKQRKKEGMATKLADSEMSLKLLTMSARLSALNNAKKIAVGKLANLTGSRSFSIQALNFNLPLVLPLPFSVSYWQREALQDNIDMKAEHYKLAAAREEIKSALGKRLPKVIASLQYSKEQTTIPVFNEINQQGTQAEIGVSIPVFQGGLGIAKENKAWANYNQYFYEFLAAKGQLKLAMQEVLADMKNLKAKLYIDQKSIALAKQTVVNSRRAFEQGLADAKTFLNAESGLFRVRSDYVNDFSEFILLHAKLAQLTGRLNTKFIEKVDRLDFVGS